MNFRPVMDCVLVSRSPAETKTSSGIFIPEVAVEKANRGRVVAMGPGKANKSGTIIPIAGINVGDEIMFAPGAGITVRGGNDEHLVMLREEEIIAVVE